MRFTDRTGPDTRVKLMTDGILLRELEHDRLLRRYDTLIIDEAHERSLNIDFLLGVLKRVLPQRPELRVVITSATIDPQRFADFFGGAPIIEVSGRSYPVEVRYRPLIGDDEDSELSLHGGHRRRRAASSIARIAATCSSSCPARSRSASVRGARQGAAARTPKCCRCTARLSTRDQERIFEKHGTRRIVLATNVAETSLTVPGIRHVVDSGLARISRYSVRGKVQRLPIEPISQASADQRKGRAGRESAGHLHSPVCGGRLRRRAGVHAAGGSAHQSRERDPADGGARARRAARTFRSSIRRTRGMINDGYGCCRS